MKLGAVFSVDTNAGLYVNLLSIMFIVIKSISNVLANIQHTINLTSCEWAKTRYLPLLSYSYPNPLVLVPYGPYL